MLVSGETDVTTFSVEPSRGAPLLQTAIALSLVDVSPSKPAGSSDGCETSSAGVEESPEQAARRKETARSEATSLRRMLLRLTPHSGKLFLTADDEHA
jgi:hypothetical protein